jgi:transcription elongation factor Elf1
MPPFIDCPFCDDGTLETVPPTDGSLECETCGRRTHVKIEKRRDWLEEIAETDRPMSEIARALTEPNE